MPYDVYHLSSFLRVSVVLCQTQRLVCNKTELDQLFIVNELLCLIPVPRNYLLSPLQTPLIVYPLWIHSGDLPVPLRNTPLVSSPGAPHHTTAPFTPPVQWSPTDHARDSPDFTWKPGRHRRLRPPVMCEADGGPRAEAFCGPLAPIGDRGM